MSFITLLQLLEIDNIKLRFNNVLCCLSTAFTAGKAVLAGASLVGIGGLCFYGLGLSNQVGAIDRAA